MSLDVNLEVESKTNKIAGKSKTLEAQELLRVEAEAILSAADRLGTEFDHALEIIQDFLFTPQKPFMAIWGSSAKGMFAFLFQKAEALLKSSLFFLF